MVSVPYRGATFLNEGESDSQSMWYMVSVPYRGATFLNKMQWPHSMELPGFPSPIGELHFSICGGYPTIEGFSFPSPIGELHFSIGSPGTGEKVQTSFRPLSGSYISQYHPRNPMFCLGQIGGLRGKSNFIEMQPFWKVKNSHKSSI